MTYEQKLAAAAEVIENDNSGDWTTGGESAEVVGKQWVDAGIEPSDITEWLNTARCFNPRAAGELKHRGIDAEEASERSEDKWDDTIGYAVSNGDMSAARAQIIIQGEDCPACGNRALLGGATVCEDCQE